MIAGGSFFISIDPIISQYVTEFCNRNIDCRNLSLIFKMKILELFKISLKCDY